MIRAYANGIWFYAAPATRDCAGCIFESELVKACKAAGVAAVEAGMPDCESSGPGAGSYIYRLDLSSGRQMDLLSDNNKPGSNDGNHQIAERPDSCRQDCGADRKAAQATPTEGRLQI